LDGSLIQALGYVLRASGTAH
jgi:hypothetical protein